MVTTAPPKPRLLVVDNDAKKLKNLTATAQRVGGLTVLTAASCEEAEEILHAAAVELMVTDLFLSKNSEDHADHIEGAEGLRLITLCKSLYPRSKIVAITGFCGVGTEVGARALESGADDFISLAWRHILPEALLEQKLRIFSRDHPAISGGDTAVSRRSAANAEPERREIFKDPTILKFPSEARKPEGLEELLLQNEQLRTELDKEQARRQKLQEDVTDILIGAEKVQIKNMEEIERLRSEIEALREAQNTARLYPRVSTRKFRRVTVEGRVESVEGETASCSVRVRGSWLPVTLRSELLRPSGLVPGQRFTWRVRPTGAIRPEDFSPRTLPGPSAKDRTRLDRLYREFLDSLPDVGGRGEPDGD